MGGGKVFLIGFMGSGKSTLGKKLATKLKFDFIDLDKWIEEVEQCTIQELFDLKGEGYFRNIEHKSLKSIINKSNNTVIALGGGTPCFFNNMDLINEVGTSIYIKYNSGILLNRLMNSKTKRPLIKGKTDDELYVYIEMMLSKRESFYCKSKFTIEKNNVKVENLIELIQNL